MNGKIISVAEELTTNSSISPGAPFRKSAVLHSAGTIQKLMNEGQGRGEDPAQILSGINSYLSLTA